MNEAKYIGLDVHQATISVSVLDFSGKLVMEAILETKAETVLQFVHGLRGSLHVTPRTTRKSYRSRVSDRTMVDTLNRTACPRQKPKASSHQQHESAEKEKIKTTLHRMGWMAARTPPLPSVVGEVFLLDIPFYRTR